jgi:hypothetical protein
MCGVLKYFVSSFAARGSTSKGKLLPEDQLRRMTSAATRQIFSQQMTLQTASTYMIYLS